LQGLADAKAGLTRRGIAFVLRHATPAKAALTLGRKAALLILDRGYLTIQKKWYAEIERGFDGRLVQVEGDVVVP
ncbi:deoxyribodipyrimidine photo-lyase, partial [Stenotrophomonas maltophilia]|uniref:deoxyribodipyrimidine photo-lyase n=1 Tax=Stenotrophomonas maltophilia TaxID=40324 RepID=UPI0013DCCD9C